MALRDALGTQFHTFFTFSSDVWMFLELHLAVYFPEENVTSIC